MTKRSTYHAKNLAYASQMETARKDVLTVLVDSPPALTVLMNAYAGMRRTDALDRSARVYQRRIVDDPLKADGVIRARADAIVAKCGDLLDPRPAKPAGIRGWGKAAAKPIDPVLARMQLVDEMADIRLPDKLVAAVPAMALAEHRCDRAHAARLEAACAAPAERLGAIKAAMTQTNLPLVKLFCAPYEDRPDFEDICQQGAIGLMDAVDKWDGKAGYRFSSYAKSAIRWDAVRLIADQGSTIRLVADAHKLLDRMERAETSFIAKNGYMPEPDDLGQALDLPVARIRGLRLLHRDDRPLAHYELRERKWPEVSPAEALYRALEQRMSSAPDPEAHMINTERAEKVNEVLRTSLRPRQEHVITQRFGLNDGIERTLQEVGDQFQLGKESIRSIEAKALKHLRHPARARKLEPFADF